MRGKRTTGRPRAGRLIRALAGTVNLLDAVGFPIARELVEEELYDEARGRTGLSDFGDGRFREPFGVWLRSLREAEHFTAVGRMVARRQAVRSLCNRLRLRAALKEHPEVLETPVQRPIIIASLPRTGTTLLQKLLSEDPLARPLRAWETVRPVRLPRDQGKEPDPRMQRARRLNRLISFLAPVVRTLHVLDLEGPEECGLLLRNTFVTANDVLAFPAYRDWFLSQSQDRLAVAYGEYCEQLQYLQWERPVPPEGHWVLKAPAHVLAVGAILRAMPDAGVILIHRDPAKVVASSCSMLNFFFDLAFKDDQDHWRGLMKNVMQWCAEGVARTERARDEEGGDRIFDVNYQRLVRDPIGTLREIYDYFGLPFSEEFQTRARQWLEANPRHKFGKHRYWLEQFGLTQQMIDEAFGSYCQRHGIEPESDRGRKPDSPARK